MPLYNFRERFVPLIESGKKTHTIRGKRRHPARVGDICHIYTGLRQKGARLLGRWPCVKVEDIEITTDCEVIVDGIRLDETEREALAVRDGFIDFTEMMKFWSGRRPFRGDIIHWRHGGNE